MADEEHAAFFDWLVSQQGGMVSSKVELFWREGPLGRGLRAKEAIGKGEVLFQIPRKALLNLKTSRFREECMRIRAGGWIPLMYLITKERMLGVESQWYPYLKLLPARFNLPCQWPEEDLLWLKGTGLLERTEGVEETCRRDFWPLFPQFSQAEALEAFHWAGSLISSYSFTEDDQISLVPLADLLNHRTDEHNACLEYGQKHLVMRTVARVEAGAEIYNTFGQLGNEELLFKYGFVDWEGNPYTRLPLSPEIIEEVLQPTKTAPLERAYGQDLLVLGKSLPVRPILDAMLKAKPGCDANCIFMQVLQAHASLFCQGIPSNHNQEMAARLISEQLSLIESKLHKL